MIHQQLTSSLSLSLSITLAFLCCFAIVVKRQAKILGAMDDSSASYIHMVQHLIEKCLIFHMTKEECMEALSKHADIKPVITSTVWKELEKENKEFFEAYSKAKSSEDRSCLTTIIHLLGNSYDNGNHILGHPGEGMMWHNIIGAATA